jgi:endonuclease/exonuclease/phosphatase family metal-dependent hydrolase
MKMSMKTMMIVCMSLLCWPLAAQQASGMRVGSYNLRCGTADDGLDSWSYRKENLKALIRYHDLDIFGTQEGLFDQLAYLTEQSGYAATGRGRDAGTDAGEHSAILYKTARFEALESGDFWLRETPDTPGLGWDATCCNRICSWAKFRDRQNGKTFYFFNVHFDHQGVVARQESGKLMVKKIAEIAGKQPVICTGDFNSTPETEQMQTMRSLLNDAYEVTRMPPYGPVGTFNGFRPDAPLNHRIDYVFVSNDFTVLKYAVLTDSREQHFPSDHLPVVVDLVQEK